jgi:Dolichyl-phosphate-mannose-protein mannosyltransferase
MGRVFDLPRLPVGRVFDLPWGLLPFNSACRTVTQHSNSGIPALSPAIVGREGSIRPMSAATAPFSTAPARPTAGISPSAIATIVATTAVIALFIAMRLWRMTDFALDGDEIFSVQLLRDSWADLFSEAAMDAIHPPLLYVLLKLWTGIGGESLLWLRLFPVTASVLCLFPVFAICRDLKISPAARNLSIAIVAVHPYAMFYSQHLRMYCLLMLASLLSAWRFERYLDRASVRNLVLLSAANLFLGYTQYYGWCIVLLEFLYLLWKAPLKNTGRFLLATVPVVLLFAPWAWYAGSVLHQRGLAKNLGWIQRPTLQELNWFWIDLTGFAEFPKLTTTGALIVLGILVLCYRRYNEPRVHWLMLLWIAPAPIAFAVSQWLPQSIWGHRHLLFTIWPLALLFADAVWRMPRVVSIVVTAAVAVWAVYAAEFHATDNRKTPLDVLTLAMLDAEHTSAPHIPLYAIDPYLHYPLGFFLDCLKTGRGGPLGPKLSSRSDAAELEAKAARFESIQTDNVSQAQGSYFWVAWLVFDYPDAVQKAEVPPPQVLERHGCLVGHAISVRDDYHTVMAAPVTCPARP